MPNSLDAFPHNHVVNHDPMAKLQADPQGAVISSIYAGNAPGEDTGSVAVNGFLTELDSLTGLDISGWSDKLHSWFSGSNDVLGSFTDTTDSTTTGLQSLGTLVNSLFGGAKSTVNIFVADQGANSLIELDNNGTQTTIALSSVTNLVDVTVDRYANIYIVDESGVVYMINAAGTQSILTFTGLVQPVAVAVDRQSNVYVVDQSAKCVYKLDILGNQTTLAFSGLTLPVAIDIANNGDVYVVDQTNAAVYRLNAENVLSTMGFSGLISPRDVAVDDNYNVYVADHYQKAVYQLPRIGAQSVVPFVGLTGPYALGYDSGANLYVADTNSGGTSGTIYMVDVFDNQSVIGFTGLVKPLGMAVENASYANMEANLQQIKWLDPSRVGSVTVGTVTDSIENHLRSIVDAIMQGINGGGGGGNNDVSSIAEWLQKLPQGNIAVTNAEALTTVSVLASGTGNAVTGSGQVSVTWTGAVPAGTDYICCVVHCAQTRSTAGASCSMISPDTLNFPSIFTYVYANAGITIFGFANPPTPTGTVTFRATSNDALSVVTLISATSICLAGVGSVQDIAYEATGQNANAALTTSFTSPALVVNAIGSFGILTDNVALSGYNHTAAYHAGATSQGGFMTDLLVGIVSSPSSPSFSANLASLGADSRFADVAIAFNPTSTVSVIGSGFRQHRVSTTAISAVNGYNPFTTFFDTNDFNTEDCVYNSSTGVLTIGYTGHYSVTFNVMEAATYVGHQARAVLYRNGSIVRNGHTLIVTQHATDAFAFSGSWSIYCQAGDTLQPGYWVSKAVSNIFIGDSAGSKSFWEVSLTNRSLM